MPWARHALHGRGEAVHGNQHGGQAGRGAGVQFGGNAAVVRREDRLHAGVLCCVIQPLVARHHGAVAERREPPRRPRRAIAVDHQSRVGLGDRPGVQQARQFHRDPGNADVPADVAIQFGRRQAQVAQCRRHLLAGMVGDQQERRASLGLMHGERCRVGRSEQRARCDRQGKGISHAGCRPDDARSSTARPTAWRPARSPGRSSPPARRQRARAALRAR